MEVVVAEEKKKIFRARKTMKISDRQQLETLHNTLLTGPPSLSNPSPPPLLNGTHKDDGQKVADKEQNNTLDSNSPRAASPVSPASRGSPIPSLSLNLSPSPSSSQSPKPKDETPTSPISPFHSLNFELKKMEEEGKKGSSPSPSNECPASVSTEAKEGQKKDTEVITEMENKEEAHTTTEGQAVESVKDSVKGSAPHSPPPPAVSGKKSDKDSRIKPECPDPMQTDNDTTEAKAPEASTAKRKVEKPSSPKTTAPASSPRANSPPSSSSAGPAPSAPSDQKLDQEIKAEEDIKEEVEDDKEDVKKGSVEKQVEKMEVDSVKVETKKVKMEAGESAKPSRPSSTPPCDTAQEAKCSTSGLKRTLSEGYEKDEHMERDVKRPKVDGVELEAQLELKITAKASSRLKLEKVVQQLVEERLNLLQLTEFDKNLQELKERVEKIDSATKHQTTLNTLQAKIARLAKKFGEANQMSENKRKQEALAAAAAAAAVNKTASAANTPSTQRPVRHLEVKQTPTTLASTSTTAPSAQPTPAPTSTSTAMVPQAPILQLITSTSNAASTLATGITTQSPTGTLLLKTAPGSGMVATGQPLLIQLPLSMTNGQTGTLVNIPVSSLSAANSLNKAKTTASTATFILKPAAATTTAAASAPAAATVPALQASTGQMSPAQISLARAVYQGGAGGISTPNAGVSVTTARTPAQSVSVAGAMSSASSPATSGPAATGSAAPGPPQGTSMTSKTDNQATSSASSTKTAAPGARPKGSVIDLTEDDDDVQVTGVKNATVSAPPTSQRPLPVVSIPNSAGARSSPQSNQNSSGNPQVTVHHRPPLDSPMKSRSVTTTTSTRASTMALPPLPSAPPPPGRLPPEAAQTSLPQQPQLKLVPSQTGIVLSWCVAETDRTCAAVDSYHLYAFHQDNSNNNAAQQHWKKIGEVKALPLPMACTLTQFQSGSTYHFAVRAKDIYGRFGSFCEPQCTNVISSNSS
ncbi:activating transcription factor 7-interacting protein 1 [Myripristis murdjan]|uniref:activating transcription factor 7-interacting protein 1 n=1 Tax=Myripristis murdjan TaxID=586833 RepID=UPI0011762A5F|nr:activating transcription factor 7-interacting protein 1 [Myripristis murdjan]XP_029909079.1 activating transcription factor 7-interacting protein 1 [Myripristis murdjan]XP_029909088.1 activating transcription factor 7-interacting protein 1 [Myripristis murdjan]